MGKYYKDEEVEQLKQDLVKAGNEDLIELLIEKNNPEYWAEKYLLDPDTGENPFKCKPMFIPFLNCNKKRRSGRVGRQCVLEGSIIHTRDGKMTQIENHPDSWLTGEKEVFEVRARGGYKAYVSKDHPFKTKEGYKRLEELSIKDEVQVLYKWDKWGNDVIEYSHMYSKKLESGKYEVNENKAELLGWLTSDGSGFKNGHRTQSIKFTNNNLDYLERVEYLVNTEFPGINCKRYKKNNGYDILFTTKSKATGQNELKNFLRFTGVDESGFPTAVANYFSKNSVEAFFRGMYPADGYTHYKNRSRSQKYECGLACGNNWQYAQYCRELLNKLGIRTQVKSEVFNKTNKDKQFYRIVFSGSDNAELFIKTIKEIRGKKLPKVSTTQRKPSKIKNIEIVDDGEEMFYSPIINIKSIGLQRVYDIEVPNKHWFICGGFNLHNCGKTVHTDVDMLHTAYFEKNSIILVFVPQKMLMNRMLDIMSNMIRKSPLNSYFTTGTVKKSSKGIESEYDHEIRIGAPGEPWSYIRFFFTGSNIDKARGQRGTHIYIDEADYHPDKAWPVITGIIKGNKDIKLTAISTPRGVVGSWYYDFCHACQKEGTEYHLKPQSDPNWKDIEPELRRVIFDEVTWKLEVEAEFVEPLGAVYKKELIDNAINRSQMNGVFVKSEELFKTLEYEESIKVLGVDWNTPQNGVRIVEICELFNKTWITRNEIISYQDYTQTLAVERILKLYDENKYTKISVDLGYGSTQIELLSQGLSERGVDSSKVLNVVDSVKKEKTIIKYYDPELSMERIRILDVSVKHKIVDLVTKYLELDLTFLNEMSNTNTCLVSEVRSFIRKPGSSGYIYSENSHSLSALQIGFHGWDMIKSNIDIYISSKMVSNYRYQDVVLNIKHNETKNGIFNNKLTNLNRTRGLGYGSKRRSIL